VTNERSAFVKGYIEALKWSSADGDHESLEGFELSRQAYLWCLSDCDQFLFGSQHLLDKAFDIYGAEMAGHDFWLTRNGHGAGYWDGDLPETLGEELTLRATGVGPREPYLGDDGRVHLL